MQIVMNISKKLYDRYKEKDHIKRCDIDEFEKALDRCTILPRKHGDLIDRDALIKTYDGYVGYDEEIQNIKDVPAIIEADKE